MKQIILLLSILMLIPIASADFSFVDAGGINPGYREGFDYVVWNQTTANVLTGEPCTIFDANVDASGYTGECRVTGKGVIYATHDTRISTNNIPRLWMITQDGDIVYTDSVGVMNLTLGYYSTVGGFCSLGNCNPAHRIYTHQATSYQYIPYQLAIDSIGDVYFIDNFQLKKMDADNNYAVSVLDSFVAGTEYPAGAGSPWSSSIYITDDESYLVVALGGASGDAHVNWYNRAGTLTKTDILPAFGAAQTSNISVITYTTNYTTNYSITRYTTGGGNTELRHNRSIGAILETLTSIRINHMGGKDLTLFLASQYQDTVYIRTTNITVGSVSSDLGNPAQKSYTTSSVESAYTTYYNNSNIILQYNIDVSTDIISEVLDPTDENYKWIIDLIDPNGVPIITTFTPRCDVNTLGTSCAISGSLSYNPPSDGWDSGNYSAKLYEYNTQNFSRALLDTSNNFTVLNTSTPGGSVGGTQPDTQPNSPVDTTGITNILQNNTFWALIITIGIMIVIGMELSKNGSNAIIPTVMAGFMSIGVFTLMGWFPAWLLFSIILVVLVAFAWNMSKNMGSGGG